jgi:tetratricopeptide (TPR) repeat protein
MSVKREPKKYQKENRSSSHSGTGIYKGVLSVFFFAVSIIFLFSLVNFIHPFTELTAKIPIFYVDQYSNKEERYVTSYLSAASRESTLNDAFRLLQKKKVDLENIEGELERLRSDKNLFMGSLEEKTKLFEENISIIGEEKEKEQLKTFEYLKRSRSRFDKEIQNRQSTYLSIWESKKVRLEEKRKEYWREIKELTLYIKYFENGETAEDLFYEDMFFVTEAKKDMLERVIFLIYNQEYDGAIAVLGDLLELDFENTEVVQKNLLISMLTVLKEYKRRLDLLEQETVFAEIKMAYINEDYSEALTHLDSLNDDDYIKPLLAGLRDVMQENISISGEIDGELVVKNRIKELVDKAAELEAEKDYSRAVKIYENLLILDLPPFDREYLINKMRATIVPSVENDFKREHNTNATRYLQSARNLYLDGEEEEALQYYRKVLTECPSSDYVEEALTELIRLIKG